MTQQIRIITPNHYMELALSKEADQEIIRQRIYDAGIQATRLENAARGLNDDAGELSSAVKKWLEYGQPLDVTNVKEEIGDCLWRLCQACAAIDVTLEEVMEANLRKLKVRYGDGICEPDKAAEAARDRDAERAAVSTLYLCPKCGSEGHLYMPGGEHAGKNYCQCKNSKCSHAWFVDMDTVVESYCSTPEAAEIQLEPSKVPEKKIVLGFGETVTIPPGYFAKERTIIYAPDDPRPKKDLDQATEEAQLDYRPTDADYAAAVPDDYRSEDAALVMPSQVEITPDDSWPEPPQVFDPAALPQVCYRCGGSLPSVFMYCPQGTAGAPCSPNPPDRPVGPIADTSSRRASSYNRVCIYCQRRPVHKHNTAGVCPDCAQERVSKKQPLPGDRDVCNQCERPIMYNGKYWEHSEGTYRHPAIPKNRAAKPALEVDNSGFAQPPVESEEGEY